MGQVPDAGEAEFLVQADVLRNAFEQDTSLPQVERGGNAGAHKQARDAESAESVGYHDPAQFAEVLDGDAPVRCERAAGKRGKQRQGGAAWPALQLSPQ